MANTRARVTAIDPNGLQSAMGKITLTEQKKLPLAVLTKSDTYVLRFWIKGNERTVSVCVGNVKLKDVRATETWTEVTIKFEGIAGELLYLIMPVGTYYIWHDKLENATIPSDYDRNQTDSETYFSQELVSLSSAINLRIDNINLAVSQQITKTDGLSTRMSSAEAQININAGAISQKVSLTDYTGTKVVSMINQTPSNILISADHIDLVGKVDIVGTKSALNTASKEYLKDISDGLEGANDTIDSWKYRDKTTINGALIETGTITADKINVNDLYALNAKIGGFSIGTAAIYNGCTSLDSETSGIYVGTDGIRNVNGNNFTTISNGAIHTNNIKVTGGTIEGAKINIITNDASSAILTIAHYTEALYKTVITPSKLSTYNISANEISAKEIKSTGLKIISLSSVSYVEMSDSSTSIKSTSVNIGSGTGKISFFNHSAYVKQTVSNRVYADSVTAKTVGADLNTLKDALRRYGLIG